MFSNSQFYLLVQKKRYLQICIIRTVCKSDLSEWGVVFSTVFSHVFSLLDSNASPIYVSRIPPPLGHTVLNSSSSGLPRIHQPWTDGTLTGLYITVQYFSCLDHYSTFPGRHYLTGWYSVVHYSTYLLQLAHNTVIFWQEYDSSSLASTLQYVLSWLVHYSTYQACTVRHFLSQYNTVQCRTSLARMYITILPWPPYSKVFYWLVRNNTSLASIFLVQYFSAL